MNKTVSITLAGLAFTVEEDGYPLLHTYLDAVERHFSSFDYGREVTDDIESRLAERFSKKLSETKTQVISKADIEQVIAELGTVEQLSGEEPGASAQTETSRSRRRLYRNPDDAVIAGVASGIAAYLGWDTTLVRVIFIIAACFGWGIAAYLILWLVMPEARSAAEKLEMRGSPLTMAGFEQAAREKAEYFKSQKFVSNVTGASKQIVQKIFGAIGRVISVLGKILSMLIGLFITASAVCGGFFAIFAAANLLANRQSPYFDQTITGAFPGPEYYAIVVLVFLAIFIPLLLLGMAGASLLRKRSVITGGLAIALASIWLASAIGTSVLLVHKAPTIEAATRAYQGETETRTYELKDFTAIQAAHGYVVSVRPGKEFKVVLTGNKRDLQQVAVTLDGNKLILDHTYNDNLPLCIFCNRHDVRAEITLPSLSAVKLFGASEMDIRGFTLDRFTAEVGGASELKAFLNVREFVLHASGASEVSLQTEAKVLDIDLNGTSSAEVSGKTDELKATLSGASELEASSLQAQTAEFEATGASEGKVMANQAIKADLSGASTLETHGTARVTVIRQSGGSEVIQK